MATNMPIHIFHESISIFTLRRVLKLDKKKIKKIITLFRSTMEMWTVEFPLSF